MASSVSFSGLASGLDTAALIDNLIRIERFPIDRLEDKKSALSSQSSKYGTLKTRLTNLQKAIEDLDTEDEVISSKVSSSDDSVFTATVTGTPTKGATSIQVENLATAERTYSNGFGDKTATGLFGTGTITIAIGTADPVSIDVTASDSLESVAAKINDAGVRVNADVIFDGTNYMLRVAGEDTGAENALTFTDSGTTLGLTDPANERQAATDASFFVDGIAMTRPTNTVADAIPGVTLNLVGTTTFDALDGANDEVVTLDVQRDPDALATKVEAFIDSYNQVQSFINTEFAYFGTAKGPGSLSGDATLRSVQSRLRSIVGSSPSGLTGAFQTFGAIGIDGDRTGSLSLDRADLERALNDDPEGVLALLNGDATAGVTGLFEQLSGAIDEFADDTDSILKSRIDAIEGRQRDIDAQIDRMELRLDKREEVLRKQFASMEQTVSGLQNQGQQLLAAMGQI
jgi:flagellar hook-associated protein 2